MVIAIMVVGNISRDFPFLFHLSFPSFLRVFNSPGKQYQRHCDNCQESSRYCHSCRRSLFFSMRTNIHHDTNTTLNLFYHKNIFVFMSMHLWNIFHAAQRIFPTFIST